MAEFRKTIEQGKIIHTVSYHSLDDFLMTIIQKPITDDFHNPASIIGDKYFTGTESFKEAWEACKFTYDNGYTEFSSKLSGINFKMSGKEEKIKCYKPVGSSVNVPRYLLNVPNNMRNTRTIYRENVVDIYFQMAYSAFTEKKQIINRGVLTLALINYLEKIKNYKVRLNLIEFSKVDEDAKEIILTYINIKNKNEKINVKKCYFPLVHPSFLRRLLFRSVEITPSLEYNWRDSAYGIPLKYDEVLKYLDRNVNNSIYISTPKELGIEGNDIDEDLKNFKDSINSKYGIFDEKRKPNARL